MATRRGLLAAGIPADVIDNGLKAGRYRSVHKGVYAVGPLSPRGRLVAALLYGGPQSALCHASALVIHELIPRVATVDVAIPGDRRSRGQVRFHRFFLNEEEVTTRDGLRITTVERALLDIAATGADIRRVAHEAIAKRLTTQSNLKTTAVSHHGRPGAPAVRRVAGEPHTRGRLERRFLRFLAENDLPRPLTNHPIGPYTVDFFYPEAGLVIELDEDGHKSEWAFEEDRARDRFLVGLGLRVMRITEASLQDESMLREEVRRAARIVR